MKVRAGQGRAQAERLRAYGELRRIEQAVPSARAEVIAAADAVVAESAFAEMRATAIDELKDFGAPVGLCSRRDSARWPIWPDRPNYPCNVTGESAR